jgi:uncharacterized protein (TIGR03067 family)
MRSLAALVTVTLLVGAGRADDPKKPTAAEDLQRFQGTWQVESWEEGGKAAAEKELKTRGAFFGANIFFFRRDDKVQQAGTVKLDPAKSPPTVNFSVREGKGKDDVLLGIYSVDGDTLKLCFDPTGAERPKDFKPDAKDGFTLVTLKKPKPAVEEVVDIAGKYRSELVDATTGKTTIAEVTVERRGDGYLVTYKHEDKLLFIGTALRKGDQLSMCWASAGQVGVSVYKIEAGPKLTGDYTMLGGLGMTGTEVLTPWRKVD